MASTLELLKSLADAGVEFVVVGGMAAVAHGSSMVTEDLDVCIRFDHDTLARLLGALGAWHPRNRMHPARPVLSADPAAYVGWRNLYVVCDAGQLDLLGEVTGVGSLEDVAKGAITVDLSGIPCRVMGLEDLIRAKRVVGRPKDLRTVTELEFLKARLSKR